jgi:hypothetical protein
MISLACGVAIFGFQTRLTRFETSTFHAAIGAAVACRCRHIIIIHLARDRIPIRTDDDDDGGRELWEEGTTQVPAKREKLSALSLRHFCGCIAEAIVLRRENLVAL